MYFVEAENLTKKYGQLLALNQFSLKVKKGSVFALLGPNGAGKTSFVKAMLGLTNISEGKITLMGKDHSDYNARKNIAYLPEKFQFYKYETVSNVLKFFGRFRGVAEADLTAAVDKALTRVQILDLKDRKVGKLSKGQTQRVGLASLLMGPVEAMILDEPFSGIDPIGSKDLKSLLLELKSEGVTLFINSHILSEMEKICDSIAILDRGQCLASGDLKELVKNQSLEDYFYSLIKSGAQA